MYTNIKTFEDACAQQGIPTTLPDFSFAKERDRQPLIDHYKLTVIVAAVNDGWEPDWNDFSQYKYYPWFRMRSARGFSYLGCDGGSQGSGVGSRLCVKSAEIAEYIGNQFLDLYQSYFTLK